MKEAKRFGYICTKQKALIFVTINKVRWKKHFREVMANLLEHYFTYTTQNQKAGSVKQEQTYGILAVRKNLWDKVVENWETRSVGWKSRVVTDAESCDHKYGSENRLNNLYV